MTAVDLPRSAPENRTVRVQRTRDNVFTVVATGQELSALVAGARMSLEVMRQAPDAPREGVELLERVLADFDRARARRGDEPEAG
jgi:hypothetical protein